jgi:hypothetical protein
MDVRGVVLLLLTENHKISIYLVNRILTLVAYYEDKINRKGGDEEQS